MNIRTTKKSRFVFVTVIVMGFLILLIGGVSVTGAGDDLRSIAIRKSMTVFCGSYEYFEDHESVEGGIIRGCRPTEANVETYVADGFSSLQKVAAEYPDRETRAEIAFKSYLYQEDFDDIAPSGLVQVYSSLESSSRKGGATTVDDHLLELDSAYAALCTATLEVYNRTDFDHIKQKYDACMSNSLGVYGIAVSTDATTLRDWVLAHQEIVRYVSVVYADSGIGRAPPLPDESLLREWKLFWEE